MKYLSASHEELTISGQLDPLSELYFTERQASLQLRPSLPSKETWDTTFMYRKSENITDFVWTSLFLLTTWKKKKKKLLGDWL